MITRTELLLAIFEQAQKAKGAFLENHKNDLFECFKDILHSCDDPAFVDADQKNLNAIKKECETAQTIVQSDSPDKTAFVDCLRRIITKVNFLKGR